jgi:hypothetical protein
LPARIREKNYGDEDPMLAYKICAARELYEETGIDLRNSLDRLKPVQLRTPEVGKLPYEYKGRIFFSVQTEDDDLSLQQNQEILASSLSKSMNGGTIMVGHLEYVYCLTQKDSILILLTNTCS